MYTLEQLNAAIARAAQAVLDALAGGLMDEPQEVLVCGTQAVLTRELVPQPWNPAWDM